MNINLESHPDINEIISYDDNSIVIRTAQNTDRIRVDKNLILTPKQIITNRCISLFEQEDVDYLISLQPEVLILTQDNKQKIPPEILTQFTSRAIGVEIMALGSVCRTYNLLALEDRQVVIVVNFP